MIYLIVASILCVIFYFKAVKPLSYWKDRGVIHKKPWPIVGSAKDLLFRRSSFFDYFRNLYREFSHKRYFGIHQFLTPILIVNDLDLIKKITVKDFEYFIDHNNIVTEELEPLLGKSLFNLKGQRWRDMRATLSPSFTGSKMKMMFTLILECAEEFTKYFEKQNEQLLEVEVKDIFTRFTNDAIATVAFGFKCDSLNEKENEFYVMGKKATSFSGLSNFAFILYNVCPKLAQILNIKFISNSITSFFSTIIKDTLKKREKEGLVRPDMIHLLMQAQKGTLLIEDKDRDVPQTGVDAASTPQVFDTDKKQRMSLTDDDIVAQALIFFFAGFDTAATLMCFVAYELALNEDVQTKLQDEIQETLDKCNEKLTYEALNKMKYMDMVVSETLRKWPPAIMLDRLCVKDYLVEAGNLSEKPFLIEKDVIVQIPVAGIHHDPKYYPNPDVFDPERFNDENKQNIKNFSYLPFGAGPRLCIASRLVLMESKTLVFNLLSKFNIVKTNKTPYPFKMDKSSFNIKAEGGFWLGLQRREI